MPRKRNKNLKIKAAYLRMDTEILKNLLPLVEKRVF